VLLALHNYRNRLQGLQGGAKRYLVSTALRAASFGIWSLLLNLYLISLGFDAAFIGLISTLFSTASLICSLPAGLIADQIGRKRAMIIGLAGMVLSRFGVAFFSQKWLIAASYSLFGIIGPLFYTSIPPFLTENSSAEDRALLFTTDGSLRSFTTFVATTVGGYLPGLFAFILGADAESAPAYRGAMLVAAALMALAMAPILISSGQDEPSSAGNSGARFNWRVWQHFSDHRLMMKLLLPRALVAFGAALVFPFLNLFYKQQFDISDATLGWIFGVTNVVVSLLMLGGGAVAERLGKIRAMLIARALSMPLLLVIGFAPFLPIVVIAHWMRSGLMRLGEPLYMAFAMEQLEDSERSTGSSLLSMSWDAGWATGPTVSGLVQVQAGFGPLFVSTLAFYALSTACVYRFFGRRREAQVRPKS